MRADRLPAVGDRVADDCPRSTAMRAIPAAVWAQERLALGVEAGERLGAGEVGEVVAPLAVLGLVVDHAVLDLDLADAIVALEVGRVVLRVPQAELDRGEERQAGRPSARSLVRRTCQTSRVSPERHEVARLDRDAVQAASR